MNERNIIKVNLFYNMLYQFLNLAIPLITIPYVSRVIGVDGVGIYSYTYSIVQYFVIFVMLGLNNYGNRTIAKVKQNQRELEKNFWNIYAMQIICFCVVFLIYIIYILVFSENYLMYFLIESIFLISALFDINWLFFGLEKFKLTTLRNCIIKVFSTILIFLFIKNANDLLLYILILGISSLITNIVLWPYVIKNIRFSRINFNNIIKHFKYNFILLIPVLAVSIYNLMDKIMLGSMTSVTAVGLYENAEKIINVPLNLITALGVVMMPRITYLLSNKQNRTVIKYIDKSMELSLFIGIPMALGLCLVSKNLVLLYLGSDFMGTDILVALLSIIIPVKIWANIIRTQYLIPKERDKIYVVSVVGGALINFSSNLILIRMWGAIGAAIGTIFAELFVMIFQTFCVKKELPIFSYTRYFFNVLLKSLVMIISIYPISLFVKNAFLCMILQVISGATVYLIINARYIISLLKKEKLS